MLNSYVTGYIEGYYGRILHWSEREALINHLHGLGMNAYLYAPKEDPLHRQTWRIPYPQAWRRDFSALVAHGLKKKVDVVPGLAPGLSFDYLSDKDYRDLLKKFRDFVAMGCTTVALLMDDIPSSLPENCKGAFHSLGEAHALLLDRLQRDLEPNGASKEMKKGIGSSATAAKGGKPLIKGGAAIKLWFCPTVYTDQFAEGPVLKSPYLLDLAKGAPADIPIMWTGQKVVAEKLDRLSLEPLASLFPGKLLLWDNLYANDYCPSRLFLGPFLGRSRDLKKWTGGIMLNPTGLFKTDLFLLSLMGAHLNGEAPKVAWKKQLKLFGVPDEFHKVAAFFDGPYSHPGSQAWTRKAKGASDALFHLIWKWKSPLQSEWYPFLYMLDSDLKLLGKMGGGKDENWLRKKYPPILAHLLSRL